MPLRFLRARSTALIAGFVGATLLPAPPARADEYAWKAPVNGNWNLPGNWNPGGPPSAADNATISTAGSYTVTLSDDRGITGITLNNATATLSHTAGKLTLGGTLALTAGTYSLNGGNISGGSITSAGGRLLLQNNNANALSNVAIGAGVLDFSAAGARVLMQGTTNLAAGTVVNLTGGISVLAFQQTTTTNGLTVNLSTSGGAYLSVEGNNTLTLEKTSTVTCTAGSNGEIAGSLYGGPGTPAVINQGLIRTTGSGSMNILVDTFTNQAGGIVRAESGALFVSSTHLTNYTGTTLTGGSWEVLGTATLNFNSRTITTLGAGTTVILNGSNPTFTALDALTANNGTVRVLGGKTFTPTVASVNVAGTIEVGTGSTFAKAINIQAGGRLEGSGTVNGAVTVGGTVAPGNAATPIGTLTTGGHTWAGGGAYEISYGKVQGSLTAGTDNDYLSSATGALAVTATPGNKFQILMNYTGTVQLPDSQLTIKIATFGGGVPAAFDMTAFQLTGDVASGSVFQLTSVGNDVFLTFTPVPEPGALLLVGAAGAGLCAFVRRRRRTVATI
jgi:fibronectin-binding autotransporter adhesin